MTDTTIVDAIYGDTIATAIRDVASAISTAAAEHGPGAVDLALTAVRIDAAGGIISGAICAAAAWGASWWAKRAYKNSLDESGYDFQSREAFHFLCFAMWGVCLTTSVVSAVLLFNIGSWAAALGYPEIKLAIGALKSAGAL